MHPDPIKGNPHLLLSHDGPVPTHPFRNHPLQVEVTEHLELVEQQLHEAQKKLQEFTAAPRARRVPARGPSILGLSVVPRRYEGVKNCGRSVDGNALSVFPCLESLGLIRDDGS